MNINHYKKIYRDIKKYIFGTNEFSYIKNHQKNFLYPIDLSFTLKDEKFYYYPLDNKGVPYKLYRSVGKQYNPTRIAAYGLAHFNDYMINNDKKSRKIFLNLLEWFFTNKYARYEYDFDWYDIKAPWISCMAQGEAISILLRGYFLTNDEKYLKKAKQALEPFFTDINSRGVSSKINEKYLFLQEFPSKNKLHVLNGFFYAFIGLHEYTKYVNNDIKSNELLFSLVESVSLNIEKWGKEKWSYYDIPKNKYNINCCTPSYHNLQISQLKYYNDYFPSQNIENVLSNWQDGAGSIAIRLKALICKLKFRLRNKAQR